MRCYSCGQTNNANARYCNGCGASLAVTAWAQPAPSEQVFTGQPYLPVETSYAPAPVPAPYAPPQPLANGYVMAADAGGYPQGYAVSVPGPGFGYAPFGYPAPAPVAGPSLVNTVTVNQVAPTMSPPPAPAPTVMADRHASGLTVVLSALFLLGGGIALGSLWFAAAQGSNDGGAWAVVTAITLVVLLLYIMIVDRLARR